MLRITVPADAASAVSYYGKASNELESMGTWQGKGAEALGLAGSSSLEAFKALAHNRLPEGGRLTERDRHDRRPLYDLTFSPPKSVALAHQLGRDERIKGAVEAAVAATMRQVERRMTTRVKRFARQEAVKTGNALWIDFYHKLSRPVNGVPDPGDHVHVCLMNATRHGGKWWSPEMSGIKESAPYFQAVFHAELATRLRGLGYGTVKTKDAFEIEGLEPFIGRFSRRTDLIELEVKRRGIKSPKGKAALGAVIREKKRSDIKADKLFEEWCKRFTPAEFKTLGSVTSRIQDAMKDEIPLGPTFGTDKLGKALGRLADAMADREAREAASKPKDASTALQRTLAGMLEEMSAVPEEKLLTEALKQGVGEVTLEGLQAELESGDFARAMVRDTAYVTTREAMTTERDFRGFATQEAEPFVPAETRLNWSVPDDPLQKAAELSPAEKASCEHALRSTTQVTLLRTKKGKERPAVESMVRRGLEKSGHTVAELDAAKLDAKALQAKADVLMVANAGQLKFGDAVRISQLPNSPRVILSGSLRDYRKPERGQVMAMLEDTGGLKSNQERPKAKLAEKAARVARQTVERMAKQVDRMRHVAFTKRVQEQSHAQRPRQVERNRERHIER